MGTDAKIAMPVGGNASRVGETAQHEDLAAYEQVMTKLFDDPKHQEMVTKSAGNWIQNTLDDQLWPNI